MRWICLIACAAALLTGEAHAQDMSASAPLRPPVVALVAAVGDRIDVVRQHPGAGGNMAPYSRKQVQLQTQALNDAALRGLSRAVADAEPDARRVQVQWVMSEATAHELETAQGMQREDILLRALIADLRDMPARQGWDRIEAIVPAYFNGEPTRLSGVGVYVQPLTLQSATLGDTGDVSISDNAAGGDVKTIDPNTGTTGKSSVFMAPYAYFERVTLDAHTLAEIARKAVFESTKYYDSKSAAIDVSQQMPFEQVMEKLNETVERAAYKSLRDVRSSTPADLRKQAVPDPANSR